MSKHWILALGLVAAASLVAMAQTATNPETRPPVTATTSQQAADGAQLRAQLHRAMADLLEAQSAANPDGAKVKELTDKVQALQTKLRAQSPGGQPLGLGPRRGPGGGMGPGYGYGYGRGQGSGAGCGWGCCARCQGCPACGCGFGCWAGPNAGTPPARPGWAFVDQDRNGVCDNRERSQARPGN